MPETRLTNLADIELDGVWSFLGFEPEDRARVDAGRESLRERRLVEGPPGSERPSEELYSALSPVLFPDCVVVVETGNRPGLEFFVQGSAAVAVTETNSSFGFEVAQTGSIVDRIVHFLAEDKASASGERRWGASIRVAGRPGADVASIVETPDGLAWTASGRAASIALMDSLDGLSEILPTFLAGALREFGR